MLAAPGGVAATSHEQEHGEALAKLDIVVNHGLTLVVSPPSSLPASTLPAFSTIGAYSFAPSTLPNSFHNGSGLLRFHPSQKYSAEAHD
jgi:hypothetical protein